MRHWALVAAVWLLGCGDNGRVAPDGAGLDASGVDATPGDSALADVARPDASAADAAPGDAAPTDDAAEADAAPPDAAPPVDAAPPDAAPPVDAAPPDAAPPVDAALPDAALPDAALPDAAPPDAAPPDAALPIDAGPGDAAPPDSGVLLPSWSATGTGTLSGLAWDPSGELWVSGNQDDGLWVRRLGPTGDERWLDTVAAPDERFESADVAIDGAGHALVVGTHILLQTSSSLPVYSSWVREYDSAGATRWTTLYRPVLAPPRPAGRAYARAAFPTRDGWLVAGRDSDPFGTAALAHYDHAGLVTSRHARLGFAGDSNDAFAVAESASGKRIIGGYLNEHTSSVGEAWLGLVDTAPVAPTDFVFVPPSGRDGAVRAVRFIGTDVVACGYYTEGASTRAFIQRWSSAGVSRWRRDVTGSGNDVCNALEVDGEDVLVAVTSAGRARVHRYDAEGRRFFALDYGGSAGLGATALALALAPDAIFLGGNESTPTGTSWFVRRYPLATAALWTVRGDSAGGDDGLTGLAWDARGELWLLGPDWVRRLGLDGRELWVENLVAAPGLALATAGIAADGTGRALVVGTMWHPVSFWWEPRRWARQYTGDGATAWTNEFVLPQEFGQTDGVYGQAVAALPDAWLIAGRTTGIEGALMQRVDHVGAPVWTYERVGSWQDINSAEDVATGPGGLQAWGGHLSEHPTPDIEGWIWAGIGTPAGMKDIFVGPGPPAPFGLVKKVAFTGGLVVGCGDGFLSAWTLTGVRRWQVVPASGDRCAALAGDGNDLYVALSSGGNSVIERYDSTGQRRWRSAPYAGAAARGAAPVNLAVSPDVVYLGGVEPTYARGNDWFVRAYTR